jgi:hypothetical protein
MSVDTGVLSIAGIDGIAVDIPGGGPEGTADIGAPIDMGIIPAEEPR